MFRTVVKFFFFRDKKEIDMKYVCAMCGKEEDVTGCLGSTSFKHGNSSFEEVLRSEGFSYQNDLFCPHCYKRLENKSRAQRGF